MSQTAVQLAELNDLKVINLKDIEKLILCYMRNADLRKAIVTRRTIQVPQGMVLTKGDCKLLRLICYALDYTEVECDPNDPKTCPNPPCDQEID